MCQIGHGLHEYKVRDRGSGHMAFTRLPGDKYSLPFIRGEETNICLNEVDKWYTITNNISACISCSVK